jgi:hypothetical protein
MVYAAWRVITNAPPLNLVYIESHRYRFEPTYHLLMYFGVDASWAINLDRKIARNVGYLIEIRAIATDTLPLTRLILKETVMSRQP